ncbi:Uncharacterised protein [Vibrio cholerae]|nr:Uncharacterised protein [Vibrio cholerae]
MSTEKRFCQSMLFTTEEKSLAMLIWINFFVSLNRDCD